MDLSQNLDTGSQHSHDYQLDLTAFDMTDFEEMNQMSQMYLPPLTTSTGQQHQGIPMGNQLNVDQLRNDINVDQLKSSHLEQLLGGGVELMSGRRSNVMGTTQPLVMLREQLNQQMRLQQLQQLQNQILQEQIQLISGQSSITLPNPSVTHIHDQKQGTYQLLTPVASSEIRATPQHNHVSPMILQSGMYMNSSSDLHNSSMSAPAALAFPTMSTASPADFLTPLTSPVIPPIDGNGRNHMFFSSEEQRKPVRNKRTASVASVDDRNSAAKRHSPSIDPSHHSPLSPLRKHQSSFKASPILRADEKTHSDRRISLEIPNPSSAAMSSFASSSGSNHHTYNISSSSVGSTPSPSTNTPIQYSPVSPGNGSSKNPVNLAPVTPASIMNLGPIALPTGLVPPPAINNAPTENVIPNANTGLPQNRVSSTETSRKKTSKVASKVEKDSSGKPTRRLSTRNFANPSLKPLLPGGPIPDASPPSYVHPSSGSSSSTNLPQSIPQQPRKTSHKAAEQKRRDSLKTSFDELRLLLPPIPLGDMDGEELLPGAMPPRGPPRGDGEGPNRGVSKLALLRCGNEYIRDLTGKVNRRDGEIVLLRNEVRKMRRLLDFSDVRKVIDEIGESIPELELDLDRDLDEEADKLKEEKRKARLKNKPGEDYEAG